MEYIHYSYLTFPWKLVQNGALWNFEFSGSGLSFWHVHLLSLKSLQRKNPMEFENLESLYELHWKKWTKPKNRFENGGFWFVSQIFVKTQFLQKSRQSSSDTVKKSWDKLNKEY